MNIAKHMETIFVIALGLVSITGLANAAAAAPAQPVPVPAPANAIAAADVNMTVITISTRRLTSAQKAELAD